jgi:nickel-dependent lactate racemase
MKLFEQQITNGYLRIHDLNKGIATALAAFGPIKRMLIVPPDVTRLHSAANVLTRAAYAFNPGAVAGIIPALGTHQPMTENGDLPRSLFKVHDWRKDCVRLGDVPADFVATISGGAVNYTVPVEINRQVMNSDHDCILSIGQVVPHEVAGMASHNKNIFVGLGGPENIHKSHFLGAMHGIERIMGHADTPVRRLFDYAIDTFVPAKPIIHVLTVMGQDEQGCSRPKGLFIGAGKECFTHAAALAAKVNIRILEKPLAKVVVNLDQMEYKTLWLGNKSIYRTRMAIKDGGELIVLAPGVKACGEDAAIDRLIRKYGYKGASEVMAQVQKDGDLKNNLSAAAHLIHGSSEGRFGITYCTGGLDKDIVEKAGFTSAPINDMLRRYDPLSLKQGVNIMRGGEEIFYIANPAVGLWTCKERFFAATE